MAPRRARGYDLPMSPPSRARPEVRAATPADRAACARMLTARLVEDGRAVDEDGVTRAVELALSQGAAAWLVVALVAGLPAGVLLANPIVSVAQGGAALGIEELFVAPEWRRRGIARALLDYVLSEARLNGLRAATIEVAPGNEAAVALVARLGFVGAAAQRMILPFA